MNATQIRVPRRHTPPTFGERLLDVREAAAMHLHCILTTGAVGATVNVIASLDEGFPQPGGL